MSPEQARLRDAWLGFLETPRLGLFGTITLKQAIRRDRWVRKKRLPIFAPITDGVIQMTAAKVRDRLGRKLHGMAARHRPFLLFHHGARGDAHKDALRARHHLHFVCDRPIDMPFYEIEARFIATMKSPSMPWLFERHEIVEITPGTARATLEYSLLDGQHKSSRTLADAFLPTASNCPTTETHGASGH